MTNNHGSVELFLLAQEVFGQEKFALAESIMDKYRRFVDYLAFDRTDNRGPLQPRLTVVIVAYRTEKRLIACLKSVMRQSRRDFEVIVVDNGGNESVRDKIADFPVLHVRCPANLILSEGRNIGVFFAKGPVVAFLDDDALVGEEYVQSIVDAFDEYDVYGLRGKVLPINTGNRFNDKAGHYDLGDIPIPSYINTEGNSAFRKDVYQQLGGMNPLLFGHEGIEISHRISSSHGLARLIYWPRAVIYHDYADSDDKFLVKVERHSLMERYLRWKYPDIHIGGVDPVIKHMKKDAHVLRQHIPLLNG